MNKKLVIVLMITVLLLGGVTSALAVQSGQDSNIIQAAYNKVNGDLRIVTDGKFRTNEVPISWNKQGIQGIQGEQGIQGIPGEQGIQGPTGPAGPAGSANESGYSPLAFAFIEEGGTKISGTENLSVEKLDYGRYRLTIEGERYRKGKLLVFVTPSNNSPVMATTYNEAGQDFLEVFLYNANRSPVNSDFQVIIYKTDLSTTLITYYRDSDSDGYGLSTDYQALYSPTGYYTATRGGDFNDNRASCYPGAAEIADSIDNDGDGEIDEGFSGTKYYRDLDQDGYGYSQFGRSEDEFSDFIIAEEPTGLYTATVAGDWEDENSQVNPGAEEILGDGKDNNCDGLVDV